jgi:hypothetical protein
MNLKGTMKKASKPILSIAKKIIRKAAEMGLDQAGSLIAPVAWPYLKKVLAPVVKELERKYPKMFFVGDEDAARDSEKAIETLSTDSTLQKMLDEGFSKLEDNQKQILTELDQIDEKLQDIGTSIEQVSEMTEEGFSQIRQALQGQRVKDDLLKRLDVIKDVREQMRRAGATPAVAALLEMSTAIGSFMMEVLETGKPNTIYTRDIAGVIKGQGKDALITGGVTEYRAKGSGPYEDEYGRTCRDITVTHSEDGKWISATNTFYRHRGKWVKIQ